ncbi:MAG: hypothetical protein NXI13_12845 [Proteobacteria bacterium]|nr:hypothetical protein [Pseudomonadota bacterium]
MTTAHIYIAASLDGYIARPDGSLDRDIDLRHSETRTFPSGLVQSIYEILPRPGQQE